MFDLSGPLARLAVATTLLRTRARDERGDVPGWVLITVMTAGLVTLIWGVADEELADMLRSALREVKG